jgi:hypothetical protein
MKKFYTLTLETDDYTFVDFLEDYPGINPIFIVEVDDVLDGAEIYKAVEAKYSNVVDKKDINFITHHFLVNEDAVFVPN